MNGETFIDTTIIVYAFDQSEQEKMGICSKLIDDIFDRKFPGYVSNQILGEIFYVLTKKITYPLPKDKAEEVVKAIIESDGWIKVNYNVETVEKAITTSRIVNVDFWDVMIGETMKENGIFKIITENEKDFRKIPGIKPIDPLKKK